MWYVNINLSQFTFEGEGDKCFNYLNFILYNVSSACYLFWLFLVFGHDAIKAAILKFIVWLNPLLVAIILATNYFVLIVVSRPIYLWFGFLNYCRLLFQFANYGQIKYYHCHCHCHYFRHNPTDSTLPIDWTFIFLQSYTLCSE